MEDAGMNIISCPRSKFTGKINGVTKLKDDRRSFLLHPARNII